MVQSDESVGRDLQGRTVSIDFDGVMHQFDGWTGYTPEGDPVPGALDYVTSLLDRGAEVVISTCRADCAHGRIETRRWLDRNGFPPLRVTIEKPAAFAYIDDRAVSFRSDWNTVALQVDSLAGTRQ